MAIVLALALLLAFLSIFYSGFLFYASVVNRGEGSVLKGWQMMPIEGRICTAGPLLIFGTIDVVSNFTLFTVIFLQLPTKTTYTLSRRMANNIATMPATWRGVLSARIVNRDLLPYTKSY